MTRLRILQAPFEETALGYSPSADYAVVWEDEVEDLGDLEAIWTAFQRVDPVSGPWPPEGFEGRSLSIGDVVEIDGRRWTPVAVGFEEVAPEVVRFSGRLPELPEDVPGVYGEGCVGCSLEDDGDGESGPNLVVYLARSCPVHAKLIEEEGSR